MLPASLSFSKNQRIDSNNNNIYNLNLLIVLSLETQTDPKDKMQLLVIELYLNLELRDYKNFKFKIVVNMLRHTTPLFYIYRMNTHRE